MSVATTSNLRVKYGRRTVIDSLSVEVPEGCVGLLGPNGAGKTTLIKTLLGFLVPARGSATVLGMNVATETLRIRQRIGLMPEQDCHIPGMNAVTFVAYAGELAGMPPAHALGRAHEVLEYCGLGEARYRLVETYSTGMKQRIKLAQALIHGPRVLFLDEPTNGLDPAGREDMLNLVRSISHGKDVNVIVSSHLLPDVERTCDAVMVMKGGAVVTQGDIARLRETSGLQMEVDLREPSETFVASVAARGGTLTLRAGARYHFTFSDGGAPSASHIGRLLFDAAQESGAQVRGFHHAQRSLEDIFMEAVE
jgi:ABC-2 type transport system ATP-binding protein